MCLFLIRRFKYNYAYVCVVSESNFLLIECYVSILLLLLLDT